jgi:hypothetical protein
MLSCPLLLFSGELSSSGIQSEIALLVFEMPYTNLWPSIAALSVDLIFEQILYYVGTTDYTSYSHD